MQVAIPIMISGIAHNIISVTDTIFVGKISAIALGAVGNGTVFYFLLANMGMGIATGGQILIGRRNGSKSFEEIGPIFQHLFYVLLLLGLLFTGIMAFNGKEIIDFITHSPQVVEATNIYMNTRSWGLPLAMMNFLFVAFFVGITRTRILIYSTLILALVNVLFDYLLVFGKFGFPEMGIQGAALASVIAELTSLVFYLTYTFVNVDPLRFPLFKKTSLSKNTFKRILAVGGPIMFQNLMSIGGWFAFYLLIEKLGEQELAISHIIRCIYMLVMIPVFGLGNATNTLVSNTMGSKAFDQVIPLIKKTIVLSISFTVIMLCLNLLFTDQIFSLFTENQELISEGRNPFYMVCAAMLAFAISAIIFNGLTGTGNVKTSFTIEFTTIIIYLIFTYYLVHNKANLTAVWSAEFIYFGLLGGFSYLYLRRGTFVKKQL